MSTHYNTPVPARLYHVIPEEIRSAWIQPYHKAYDKAISREGPDVWMGVNTSDYYYSYLPIENPNITNSKIAKTRCYTDTQCDDVIRKLFVNKQPYNVFSIRTDESNFKYGKDGFWYVKDRCLYDKKYKFWYNTGLPTRAKCGERSGYGPEHSTLSVKNTVKCIDCHQMYDKDKGVDCEICEHIVCPNCISKGYHIEDLCKNCFNTYYCSECDKHFDKCKCY